MSSTALTSPGKPSTAGRLLPVCFGAAALLIHFLYNGGYGYFRDELYYIACSRHLAFGYVDLPPLSPLLLWLNRRIFGDSLFALRLLPAIASALTVGLTSVIAREMGGRCWAISLSCASSLGAVVYLANDNLFSMNSFEPLFWMGCVYLLVRIINGGSPTLWLWFGVLAGFGFENKHSMTFFGAGIVIGLLFTLERRHLREKWIWLGGLIAVAIALPNIIWQMHNHWPTWELLTNVAHSHKNVVLSPCQFVVQQVVIMNPATFPIWLAGLIWLLVSRDGRRYAAIALAYLATLLEFIVMHGKHYYLAPAYPMLFAAGGIAIERLFRVRLPWVKPAWILTILVAAALFAPVALPILPPEKLVAYMKKIHFEPPRTETSHTAVLPQHFADQFGWPETARSVSRAFNQLSPEDQQRVAIFCQNYGEAGAIDFFGRKDGLPPAISGHQNYFLWGPGHSTGEVILVLDDTDEDERQEFRSVQDLGQVESNPWAMPSEQRLHIYLCRDFKGNLRDFWPQVKSWL